LLGFRDNINADAEVGLCRNGGADADLFRTISFETTFLWIEATVSVRLSRSKTDWWAELVSRALLFDRRMDFPICGECLGSGPVGEGADAS